MASPGEALSNEGSVAAQPTQPPAQIWELVVGLFIVMSTGAMALILFQGIAAAIDLNAGPTRDLWSLVAGLTGTWVGLMLATALPFALRKMDVRRSLSLGIKWRVDVPLGIAAGLFGQYVIVYLTYLPVYFFDSEIFTDVGRRANDLADLAVGWGVIPFVLSTCLFAPLFEELFFRGLVLRSFIAKWGATWGVVISGLVFGAFHLDPLLLPGLALFGMLLGYIAHRTGRIGACVFAHIAFNSATVVSTVLL